jgi:ferric-dicitrate binding protein FerR (iron transport regulator)
MSAPRYSELAAKALARATDETPPDAPPAARQAAIEAIARALAAKRRRRRAAWIALGAAAAAAALVLAVRAPKAPAPSARTAPPNAPEAPAIVARASGEGARITGGAPAPGGGEALAPGAHVVALPAGHARLAFVTGTVVEVEGGGEVTIVQADRAQILALGQGALRADVMKLGLGERFVVRTSDAEVEVRGTSFRVASVAPDPSCGDGTATRVTVFEGVVAVRGAGVEEKVAAGETWPRGCDAPKHATAAPPRASPPAPSSTLATQNALYAEALAAKRSGDVAGAIAKLDRLLAAYPDGPLAESAAAQRMKLLRDVDPPRAREAARAYLERYPDGVAKTDADAILSR